jgi:hypothetical protein
MEREDAGTEIHDGHIALDLRQNPKRHETQFDLPQG